MQTPSAYWTIRDSLRGCPMPTRRQLANAIRALSMDAVQNANSGHPGMPMGMADIAEVLWRDFLKHNPGNPLWPDRDRFVLSNGHGSMLLYSRAAPDRLSAPLEELKNFRQLGSRPRATPSTSISSASRPRPARSARDSRTRSAWRSRRRMLAATFNRPGSRDRRSPHLGVPRRRLPDGGHLARGLLARRHAGASAS